MGLFTMYERAWSYLLYRIRVGFAKCSTCFLTFSMMGVTIYLRESRLASLYQYFRHKCVLCFVPSISSQAGQELPFLCTKRFKMYPFL